MVSKEAQTGRQRDGCISRYLASANLAGLVVALIAVMPKRAGAHPEA